MPLAFVEDISGIRCGVWRVEEEPAELVRLLGDDGAVARIRNEVSSGKRRAERLSVTLLLRTLTGGREFVEHDGEGKPFLGATECFVSVSHCRGFAAVALAPFPLGVDIERVSERQLNVAGEFMLPAEKACVFDGKNPPKEAAALVWSVKEAVYKLAGENSLHMGSGIRVENFALSCSGLLNAVISCRNEVKTASANYRFFSDTVLVISRFPDDVNTSACRRFPAV